MAFLANEHSGTFHIRLFLWCFTPLAISGRLYFYQFFLAFFTCCKKIIIVVKRFLLFLNRCRHGRGRFWSCCRPIIRHGRSCSPIIRHGGSCTPIGRRCSPIISGGRGCRKLFPRILKCCLQTVIRERGCGLSSCLTFVLPLICQCLQGSI